MQNCPHFVVRSASAARTTHRRTILLARWSFALSKPDMDIFVLKINHRADKSARWKKESSNEACL